MHLLPEAVPQNITSILPSIFQLLSVLSVWLLFKKYTFKDYVYVCVYISSWAYAHVFVGLVHTRRLKEGIGSLGAGFRGILRCLASYVGTGICTPLFLIMQRTFLTAPPPLQAGSLFFLPLLTICLGRHAFWSIHDKTKTISFCLVHLKKKSAGRCSLSSFLFSESIRIFCIWPAKQ